MFISLILSKICDKIMSTSVIFYKNCFLKANVSRDSRWLLACAVTPLLQTDYHVNTPLQVIGGENLARRAAANQRIVFLSRRCKDSKLTNNAKLN